METYEIDSLSEIDLLDCIMLLTQRYNDLVLIASAMAQTGKLIVKQMDAENIKNYPLEQLQVMKYNLILIRDALGEENGSTSNLS